MGLAFPHSASFLFKGKGVSSTVKPTDNEVCFNNLHGDGTFDSMEFGAGFRQK